MQGLRAMAAGREDREAGRAQRRQRGADLAVAHDGDMLGPTLGDAAGRARQPKARIGGEQHPGHAEVRGGAQHRAEVVRVPDTGQPGQLGRTRGQCGQPRRECRLDRRDHIEDDTLVVLRARQAFEVRVGDDAIADPLACAPGEDVAEARDQRLGQVDLADRLRPPRMDRTARGDAEEPELRGVARRRPRRRRPPRLVSRSPAHPDASGPRPRSRARAPAATG